MQESLFEADKEQAQPSSGVPLDAIVICPACRGDGVIDTGGVTPWGEWINVGCELCKGTGKTTKHEAKEAGWCVGI